jgi:ferredoxin--NADP+ reductase
MDPEPKGIFTLGNLPKDARLVLVATGTGLAPYVSMLRRWPASAPEPRWSRAVVIHGVRHPEELGYRSEIEARARTDARVTYVPVVSRATTTEWSGLAGRVQRVLEPDAFRAATGETLAPDRHHVFLCGNPDMIRDVRAQLEPLGFRLDTVREPGALHLEKYW